MTPGKNPTLETIVSIVILVTLFGLMLYFPRMFGLRTRAILGMALFLGGCAGVVMCLALLDTPFMRNENFAFIWMCISVGAILESFVMLPSVLEWWRT